MFRGRHFEDAVIVSCVRWYLSFTLSYRDVREMIAERNVLVDHSTIWHWVQKYGPILENRIKKELRITGRSWRVDETMVPVAGRWQYLYRAVDKVWRQHRFLPFGRPGQRGGETLPSQGFEGS